MNGVVVHIGGPLAAVLVVAIVLSLSVLAPSVFATIVAAWKQLAGSLLGH